MVAELMDFYARFHKSRYPDLDGSPMHDPVCIAHVVDPTLDDRARRVHRGRLHRPARAGAARTSTGAAASTSAPPNAKVGLDIDGDRFAELVVERISSFAVIVFAAIAPHGGPVFDDPAGATRQGMEELGRRFAAARPEAVIVVTPHGLHVDGHFAVVRSSQLAGDASQWTDADTRYEGPGEPDARRRLRLGARRTTACRRSASRSARPLPAPRRCRSTGAR